MDGNPERVAALSAWQSEVGRLALRGRRSFNDIFPAPPQGLTPADTKAIGFEFHNERSAYNFLDPGGKSTVRVDFSPGLRHQAVLIQGPDDWSGALLWVDEEAVPVPRDPDGNPLTEKSAEWLDDRFVYARIGGLWDHPLLDPGAIDKLGNLRGVVIWDTLEHESRVELPEPRQRWTSPLVGVRDNSLHIYADGDAFRQNRADRVIPIRPPRG
jgi:hypothetical protein